MIELVAVVLVYQCLRCRQRYAGDGFMRDRRCLCGGDLTFNRPASVERLLANDEPLDQLAGRLEQIGQI